jgi:murein DD-endopeptidase MepM/ murein hydrolase activator NlpD
VAAVAERFGVTEKALKSQNGLSRRGVSLKSGQRLMLPEGARDHGAPKAETETATSRRLRGRIGAPVEEEAPLPSAGADRAVMGRVTEVPGPSRTYRTRKGDTLEKVADRLGVSVSQLKKQNHLRSSHLRRGQTLHAPGGMVKAYVVAPSDTTYGIARRFGVTIEALRAANGMGRRGTIHTGERLRLPSGWRDHGPGAGQPLPSEGGAYNRPSGLPVTPVPLPTPRTYTPPTTTPGTGPAAAPTSSPPPSDAQVSELGRGKFLWPLRGEIISDFGPKAGSQEGAGINISANVGDPVRAAAAGEVAYAGDQVPGYGNLVLITHPDGWVTAYSHLSKLEVKMQQKVTQGQEIGQAGSTGGLSSPQLHFEVRYRSNNLDRARPIDPKLVLPK